jgi:glycerol-3-phosphate acyltransferase PlsY
MTVGWTLPAALLAAYLIGSIPVGLLLVRWFKGEDIRQTGSGNIGATNVWRFAGPRLGIPVFILDCAKGILAVSLGRWAAHNLALVHVLAGIAGIVGNNWSVFLRFKGGRGVSITLGVIIALAPQVAALTFALWLAALLATRYVSVSSILAALSAPVFMFVFDVPLAYKILAGLCCAFILVRHIPNFRRLLAGTERRISLRSAKGGDGS